MKKLIAGICVTMLLASCGNDAEKKASEKLSAARSAFAQGDYNEAKLQIDSIKILYPKAFDARREGIKLMQQVELKEQQQTLVYLDSMMQTKQQELEKIKNKYVLEKDAEYQRVGREKSAPLFPAFSGKRAGSDEYDFHLLRRKQHPSFCSKSNSTGWQLCRNTGIERQLRNYGLGRKNRKSRL